jgi:DNA-binding MarR family transcriptional regulator
MAKSAYHECTAIERDILYQLRKDGELSGIELVERLDRSQPGISERLRNLEHKGLVERRQDGTTKYNSLTDKGRSVTTQAFDAYREAL